MLRATAGHLLDIVGAGATSLGQNGNSINSVTERPQSAMVRLPLKMRQVFERGADRA